MSRLPRTSPRTSPNRSDSQEERLPPSVSALDALGLITPLGRPYRTDEEKTQVYSDLISLKVLRKTNAECAQRLGVSERTVVNYLADPYYKELVSAREAEATEGARVLVGELAFKALQTLDRLMDGAKSEFVQYKAAETVGTWLGLEFPRDEVRQDAREEVARFLAEATRRGVVIQQTDNPTAPVNVNILVTGTSAQTVESLPLPTVLPGGRLPPSYGGRDEREREEEE